jgi:hypothetical protein
MSSEIKFLSECAIHEKMILFLHLPFLSNGNGYL